MEVFPVVHNSDDPVSKQRINNIITLSVYKCVSRTGEGVTTYAPFLSSHALITCTFILTHSLMGFHAHPCQGYRLYVLIHPLTVASLQSSFGVDPDVLAISDKSSDGM